MKRVIQFLGLPLAIAVSLVALLMLMVSRVVLPYLTAGGDYEGNCHVGTLIGVSLGDMLLAILGLSVLYIVVGVSEYIAAVVRKKKIKEASSRARRMILRGVIGVAVSLILLFILNLVLSPVCGPGTDEKLPSLSY
jgi:hypothetical protein